MRVRRVKGLCTASWSRATGYIQQEEKDALSSPKIFTHMQFGKSLLYRHSHIANNLHFRTATDFRGRWVRVRNTLRFYLRKCLKLKKLVLFKLQQFQWPSSSTKLRHETPLCFIRYLECLTEEPQVTEHKYCSTELVSRNSSLLTPKKV